MEDYKGVVTRMCSSSQPRVGDGSHPTSATSYQRTLGKLQYLEFTRLDIAFVVNRIISIYAIPEPGALEGFQLISNIVFKNLVTLIEIYMYANVDWAGDPCDIISTSNYILF